METLTEVSEKTYQWEELTPTMVQAVLVTHGIALRIGTTAKKERLRRCFELAKPMIVFATDMSYCRVHPDSVSETTLIINQYL